MSDAELREELRKARDWTDEKPETGLAAVLRWSREFSVSPGREPGINCAWLYKHFVAHGYKLDSQSRQKRGGVITFGRHLRTLGFPARRQGGRVSLTQATAMYFRAWARNQERKDAEGL